MYGQAVNCARARLDRRHAIRPAERIVSKVGRMIVVVDDYRVCRRQAGARWCSRCRVGKCDRTRLFLRALPAGFAIFQEQHLALPRLACHVVANYVRCVSRFLHARKDDSASEAPLLYSNNHPYCSKIAPELLRSPWKKWRDASQ